MSGTCGWPGWKLEATSVAAFVVALADPAASLSLLVAGAAEEAFPEAPTARGQTPLERRYAAAVSAAAACRHPRLCQGGRCRERVPQACDGERVARRPVGDEHDVRLRGGAHADLRVAGLQGHPRGVVPLQLHAAVVCSFLIGYGGLGQGGVVDAVKHAVVPEVVMAPKDCADPVVHQHLVHRTVLPARAARGKGLLAVLPQAAPLEVPRVPLVARPAVGLGAALRLERAANQGVDEDKLERGRG
eukprot:CAMPEP_0194591178 /NCGR_PEP_ID=MMETSP0292-20121207/21887_1 /TAXON_ID=39354 /ORGANISM="Heterosigma akashiwo, Strain CCMP2393" /LENGTH=244 /DNA_ID=CAMNT_0039449155 /DNA_START=452 /DNA_END=1185 /DNA_ORIENTATION=-